MRVFRAGEGKVGGSLLLNPVKPDGHPSAFIIRNQRLGCQAFLFVGGDFPRIVVWQAPRIIDEATSTINFYCPRESAIDFEIFAMTLSRVASSAGESDTKTAMAKCFPFGRVIIPMSFVAAVIPF